MYGIYRTMTLLDVEEESVVRITQCTTLLMKFAPSDIET